MPCIDSMSFLAVMLLHLIAHIAIASSLLLLYRHVEDFTASASGEKEALVVSFISAATNVNCVVVVNALNFGPAYFWTWIAGHERLR